MVVMVIQTNGNTSQQLVPVNESQHQMGETNKHLQHTKRDTCTHMHMHAHARHFLQINSAVDSNRERGDIYFFPLGVFKLIILTKLG